jgi:hypothetical protein
VSSKIGWSYATEYWPFTKNGKNVLGVGTIKQGYTFQIAYLNINQQKYILIKNTDLELDEIPSPPLPIWRECLSSYTKVQNLHFNILLYKKTNEVHNSNKYKTTQRYNGKHFLTSDTKQKVPFRGENLFCDGTQIKIKIKGEMNIFNEKCTHYQNSSKI